MNIKAVKYEKLQRVNLFILSPHPPKERKIWTENTAYFKIATESLWFWFRNGFATGRWNLKV
jgi:hypothetical protein